MADYIIRSCKTFDKDMRLVFRYTQWAPDLIYRDICALANGKTNNCGYILVGAPEKNSTPAPVLTRLQVATIKSEMAIYNTFIRPDLDPQINFAGTDQKPVGMIIITPTHNSPYVVPKKVSEGPTNYRRYLQLGLGIIAT